MSWENINLSKFSERSKSIVDEYSFGTLLSEISCNISEINKKSVTQQFELELNKNIKTAKDVFKNNLDNIVAYSLFEQLID